MTKVTYTPIKGTSTKDVSCNTCGSYLVNLPVEGDHSTNAVLCSVMGNHKCFNTTPTNHKG